MEGITTFQFKCPVKCKLLIVSNCFEKNSKNACFSRSQVVRLKSRIQDNLPFVLVQLVFDYGCIY